MPVEGYIKKKQNQENVSGNIIDTQVDIDKKSADFTLIKVSLANKVRERIIEKYTMDDLNDTSKMDIVTKEALNLIEEEIPNLPGAVFLDAHEKSLVLEKLLQNMFGFGVLDPLIKDSTITEIMVNGTDNIFIEKSGRIVIATNSKGTNLKFDSPEELSYVIDKIVAPINRKVDDSNPIVDARLPNGFRVNIVLGVISLDGTIITIRKFPESPYTMDKLVDKNSLPQEVADFLMKLVKARYNLFVSGGTGSGKTTFLNALSNFINKDERVITIEDAAELKIMGIKNLIRLETRPPNVEGKGAITMRDLLKSALRMRPDRIVVGEVRGGEALEMLQAMNTGHDGSLSTGHANSAADMLARLETMVLMAGMELPLLSIRQQVASAIDIIVHLGKLRDGTRRVLQISEMLGATSEGYITNDLFKFDAASNKLVYTGQKLQKTYKLKFMSTSKDDGELGRAVITTNYSLPPSFTTDTDSETTGLFQRFLQTKVPTEKSFKVEDIAPSQPQHTVPAATLQSPQKVNTAPVGTQSVSAKNVMPASANHNTVRVPQNVNAVVPNKTQSPNRPANTVPNSVASKFENLKSANYNQTFEANSYGFEENDNSDEDDRPGAFDLEEDFQSIQPTEPTRGLASVAKKPNSAQSQNQNNSSATGNPANAGGFSIRKKIDGSK